MTTIHEVINELDEIIKQCKASKSKLGYFAALYRAMTQSVLDAIETGYFDDGARMAHLDVLFAKRYLDAWNCYAQNQPCSPSWKTVFDARKEDNLVVLQHLILGINTHINLDLAVAAAATCPGDLIFGLENDFSKINALIATLTDLVQARLETIWWPMKLLKRVVNGREKAIINFSITTARKTSWANAVALATISGKPSDDYIQRIDATVNIVGGSIINPGAFTKLLLMPVRWIEYRDVNRVIDILNQPFAVK